MPVKVSVVVPVFNPGHHINDLIASLLRQDMPASEYEAIFVDDGSTDGTPSRLDALDAEHPHFHVVHQENSGWSGKPRNVGIDHAQGEYIFLADNDDWLGDEALRRMYDYARANDADILVGKMVGVRRSVPRELFRRNLPHATLADDPLIDSLTPHKLFRRAFLDEHRLRFPEGRRRLEDHVFVVQGYLLARAISVLSDYACYYHVRRDDASNAAFQGTDPVSYFKHLREALDIVERYTEPGPLRDKLHRRWLRVEMVERMRGRRLLAMPPAVRGVWMKEIAAVVRERFGPGVERVFPPVQRAVTALVTAERLDDLLRLAEWEAAISTRNQLHDVVAQGDGWLISLSAELYRGDEPLTFVADGERALFDLPVSEAGRELLASDVLDITESLGRGRVDIVVKSRTTSEETYYPATTTLERIPADGSVGPERFRVVLRSEVVLEVGTGAGGRPLASGIWDFVARVVCCGWSKESKVGARRSDEATAHRQPVLAGDQPRLVVPYWTAGPGNLAFDVGQTTRRWVDDLRVSPADVRAVRADGAIRLSVPLRLRVARTVAGTVVRLTRVASTETVERAATLRPASGSDGSDGSAATAGSVGIAELILTIPPGLLGRGIWSVAVRAPNAPEGRFAPVAFALQVRKFGWRTVIRPVGTPNAKDARPATRPVARRIARRAVQSARRLLRRARLRTRD